MRRLFAFLSNFKKTPNRAMGALSLLYEGFPGIEEYIEAYLEQSNLRDKTKDNSDLIEIAREKTKIEKKDKYEISDRNTLGKNSGYKNSGDINNSIGNINDTDKPFSNVMSLMDEIKKSESGFLPHQMGGQNTEEEMSYMPGLGTQKRKNEVQDDNLPENNLQSNYVPEYFSYGEPGGKRYKETVQDFTNETVPEFSSGIPGFDQVGDHDKIDTFSSGGLNIPGLSTLTAPTSSALPGMAVVGDFDTSDLIKRKRKNIFTEFIKKHTKEHDKSKNDDMFALDAEYSNYATPDRLFDFHQCSRCGIRESDLTGHLEMHNRQDKAERMERIMRREWYANNNDINTNTNKTVSNISHLLNSIPKFLPERIFVNTPVNICEKCNKRIRLTYDNIEDGWYMEEGIKVRGKVQHRGCNK